jgi:predicted nucleic acid-binding protein
VFDASPLIALAATGLLERLDRLGVDAVVPMEVRDEVVGEGRAPGHAERLVLDQLFLRKAILVDRVRDTTALKRVSENPRLSRADAAALCLARERRARLIADDRDLRAAARALGVVLGGSLYVLALAVAKGVIAPREAVEASERMIAHGWYCSPSLLKSFTDLMVGGK